MSQPHVVLNSIVWLRLENGGRVPPPALVAVLQAGLKEAIVRFFPYAWSVGIIALSGVVIISAIIALRSRSQSLGNRKGHRDPE